MSDKMTTQRLTIRMSDEYDKFQFHEHNRVLRDTSGKLNVRNDLFESMRREGYRIEEPISAYRNADGTLTIIDGHNRFLAARALGIPVAYLAFTRNGAGEWTPIKHSATQRTWRLADYAQAYAREGNADYAELVDYCNEYGIGMGQAASMFYGQSASSGNTLKPLKQGQFKIKDRLHPKVVAEIVTTAAAFHKWAKGTRMVGAVSACMFAPGFKPPMLKEKIIKFPEQLVKQRDMNAQIENLDKVYNFAQKQRYELAADVRKAMRERQR
jgi:hypothetical protein